MGLTPLDAEKFEFQAGFRGYDRNQVEQFRAMVVQALEGHIHEAVQFKRRIEDLDEKLAGFKGNEDLIRNSMVLAQKTGEDVVANAREEAEMIKARAQADCQELRNELARLRAEREEFEYSFHGLLSGFLRRLEQANPRLGGAAADSQKEAPAVHESAVDLMARLTEGLVVEEELDELPPPQPPGNWQPEPDIVEHRLTSTSDELDRDADHADFSRILSDAPALSHGIDSPPVMDSAPPRDLDEDLDISAELEQISEQNSFDDEVPWHQAKADPETLSAGLEEMPDPGPLELEEAHADQAPAPQGLEEVQGLQPPPEDFAWETPAEPQVDDWAKPEPAVSSMSQASLLSTRLQPSRSVDPAESPAAQPDTEETDEGEPGSRRELPPSNLDQIFSGLPSEPAPEEESEDELPYRADW